MVQVGNLMLGVFFVFLAMVLGLYNSSLQADYDQYCTGLVGFFVELGSEGKCSDLKSMITMTSVGTGMCGLLGIVFTILGLTKADQPKQMVMVVPYTNQVYSNQPMLQQQSVNQPYQVLNQSIRSQNFGNNFKFCQFCGTQNNVRNKKCTSCKNKFM